MTQGTIVPEEMKINAEFAIPEVRRNSPFLLPSILLVLLILLILLVLLTLLVLMSLVVLRI